MKKVVAVLMCLVLLGMLCACSNQQQNVTTTEKPEANTQVSEEKYKETLYTAWLGLDTADPFGSTGAPTQFVTNMTFDTLTYIDADSGEVCSELAKSWEDVSAEKNGKDWKVQLQEGVKFHNGETLTTEDVKFTWEYCATGAGNVIKPNAASTYVESYEIVDNNTMIFHLVNAMPDFPSYMEVKIYNKKAFDTMEPKDAGVIGTGPYYFNKEQTRKGVQYVVTRFDDYWRGMDDYKTINFVFKEIEDDNTRIASLMAGELDYLFDVPSVSYSMLESASNIDVQSRSGANSYYVGFNYKNTAFENIEVRKAIMQAINGADIVNVAFEGGIGGTENHNFCVPTGLGYSEVQYLKYDLEAAKTAIENLGLAGTSMTLIYTPEKSKMAEAVQANLNAAGLNVILKQQDGANWSYIKSSQEGFDLFLDYAAYQGALLYNFNRFFYTGGSSNVCGYYSAEYEKLQDDVSAQSSWEGMLDKFAVLQQWVADNVPLCPVVRNNMNLAYRTGMEGIKITPSTNYMDFSTYYIKEK